MRPPALIVAALVTLGLISLSVVAYVNRPHHASCLVISSDGQSQLYFGSPGAGLSPRATSCQYQFLTAGSANFVRFNAGRLSYTAKLTPFTRADEVQGADALPTAGGNTLRCHVSHGAVIPGGILACSFGFWQLVPRSDGVVVRLQRGHDVSSYQLTPAPLPAAAHRLFW